MDNLGIASRIKGLMAKRNISQYKLQKETKIPTSTLSEMLNAKEGKEWKLSHLIRIAIYFNTSLDYLAKGIDNIANENLLKENYELKNEIMELRDVEAKYKTIQKILKDDN